MQRHTRILCALLISGLTISGAASADGRGKGGAMRTIGLVQPREASQPARPANTVSTVQEGRGNAAGILQTGTGNTAGIRQFGRANTGTIIQAGSGNTACLFQAGRNLDGVIEQTGDNQSTGLLQTRWGSSEIPVEICSSATTPADVMAYAPERPRASLPSRRRVARLIDP